MANLIKENAACSPESTISISSLLASCSLGSSQRSSRSVVSSIWYKEKLYESASDALEAYIEDYEGSLLSPAVSTGKICIQKTPVKRLHSRHKVSGGDACSGDTKAFSSTFKSQVINDLDLASLTTDDLLAFPSDGSLPLHQAYISKPVMQRSKQRRKKQKSLKYTLHSSFDFEREQGFQHNLSALGKKNLTGLSPCKNVNSGTVEKLHFSVEGDGSQATSKFLLSKNYPRWLTSQKSDLNVSGITSIPDVKYPMWLKNYGLLSDSVDKDLTSKFHTVADCSSEQISYGLCSVTHLDKLDSCIALDNHKHLRSVGDEGIHEMSSLNSPAGILRSHSKEPFRDDMIELLILKAERALESSLCGVPSSMENIGSPQTEDVVEAERSWEKIPVTFKSPVPVFCEEGAETLQTSKLNLANDFLKDCSKNDSQIEESTLSGGNHHGPVEALKQMLFNLQTLQQNYSYDKTEKEEMKNISETESELQLFDKEMMPVKKSLKKAMHHLSRLKKLVEDSEEGDQEKNQEEVQSN